MHQKIVAKRDFKKRKHFVSPQKSLVSSSASCRPPLLVATRSHHRLLNPALLIIDIKRELTTTVVYISCAYLIHDPSTMSHRMEPISTGLHPDLLETQLSSNVARCQIITTLQSRSVGVQNNLCLVGHTAFSLVSP